MNPVGQGEGVEQAPNPLLDHLNFIQLRRRGYDMDAIIQQVIDEQQLELNQRLDAIRARLLAKQQEVGDWNQERVDEIAAIDIFDAANFQRDNIEQTVQSLLPVEEKLEKSVDHAKGEFVQKQAMTQALSQDLRLLRNQLRRGKGRYYAFQEFLDQFGQKMPDYLSQQVKK